MNPDNPRVSLYGTVSQLDLHHGMWVQVYLRSEYDINTGQYGINACVELQVTEEDEIIIRLPKDKVKIQDWQEVTEKVGDSQ